MREELKAVDPQTRNKEEGGKVKEEEAAENEKVGPLEVEAESSPD